MLPGRRIFQAALAAGAVGCARTPAPVAPAPETPAGAVSVTPPPSHLPEVPRVDGPFKLELVYPTGDRGPSVRDSIFVFGSTGTGAATVTVNGTDAPVQPNGAWLAWIPISSDTAAPIEIVGRTATDSARLVYYVRRYPPFVPPVAGAWIDPQSTWPAGNTWVAPTDYVRLSVRAAPGALVRLRFANGDIVPFVPDPQRRSVPSAMRDFDRDTLNLRAPIETDRYTGIVRGRAFGRDEGPVAALGESMRWIPPKTEPWPILEAILGSDTARIEWPFTVNLLDSLPVVVSLGIPAGITTDGDSIVAGRATPRGSYNWFFPAGTRAMVRENYNGFVRLELANGVSAWVPSSNARMLPPGTPVPQATVGSLTLTPLADRVRLRIPLGERIPFQTSETEHGVSLTLYRAVGDLDWIRYGQADSLVRLITWTQVTSDQVRLDIDLATSVWGYRTYWDGGDLILEIRRPPILNESDPLRGRIIVVDAGHPPGGATGPTGLREAEANLAVALQLQQLLEKEGAVVRMTRTTDSAVSLPARSRFAEEANADLFVSIHNNALPDGVNPFTNNGTSVFYNQPRSLPLAREIQHELLQRLGLRDLGVGRGDLAVVRQTWMPSVLCEGLFMIIPEQEAALRSPEGQALYATAVAEGIRRYLRDVARRR